MTITIQTEEQAQALATEIMQLEATVKQLKDQLKEYVDQHGTLQAGGIEWGYRDSISWKIRVENMKEFMQLVAIEGFNPFELISVSATNLKKLGWNDETLGRIADKKVTSSFRSTKL